jgi:hypothetical protein
MRASSDFSSASRTTCSRFFSTFSNAGQPNLASTASKMRKATSMGMNSSICGKIALMPE